MRVVVAPDKFKGTATAPALAQALADVASRAGHDVVAHALADGGDGTLDALGGANRTTTVTGPLGDDVEADWRLSKGVAVIEMARASGLVLAGGAAGNDPLAATTRGTGELIMAAVSRGAKRIIVGLGGSATTDGGLGAVEVIGSAPRLGGVQVEVATDVFTTFVDAAPVFGPQKGATPAQVAFLQARLRGVAERYRDEFGVDVEHAPGSGAAGGLGGGLLAVGAEIIGGFDLIADEVGLFASMEAADLVVTGEGQLDAESLNGKVVGGVAEIAAECGAKMLVIAGAVDASFDPARFDHAGLPAPPTVISLAEVFGLERAMAEPVSCAAESFAAFLASL